MATVGDEGDGRGAPLPSGLGDRTGFRLEVASRRHSGEGGRGQPSNDSAPLRGD